MNDTLRAWLFDPTVGRLVAVVIGIAIIVTLVRALSRSAGQYIKDGDARYRVRKLISLAGYVAALIVVTTVYSSRLAGLTVVLGVAGAGIAFTLQEVIASVAGWMALTFSRFYSPGDRIQLGGIKGDVIDIGVLRTTLMEMGDWVNGDLYNGRVVRVANSFVFKEPVFNYSADFPFLWDEIRVPVRYGSDRVRARRLFEEALRSIAGDFASHAEEAWQRMLRTYLLEPAQVAPMVTLVATDNWLEYTLRYTVDVRRRRLTKDALFSRILDDIDATGGRVALASATFELVAAPTVHVNVDRDASGTR